MQNSLINKIKKNISLEDQVINEAEYLLSNIEYFGNKNLVFENLTEIEKIANDRKLYFINLLELIEANNVSNLTDCLQTMNCNLKKTEEELKTLKKIENSIFYC